MPELTALFRDDRLTIKESIYGAGEGTRLREEQNCFLPERDGLEGWNNESRSSSAHATCAEIL
jgi:hypothetical protein